MSNTDELLAVLIAHADSAIDDSLTQEPVADADSSIDEGAMAVLVAGDDSSIDEVPPESATATNVVLDLGTSIVIKGDLGVSEDLTLYGHMEGSVTLPGHTLTIGPDARINAAITAKTVVVLGAVFGNVTAGDKVEVQTTGSVTGDVMSPRLAIADGGCLCGRVQTPPPAIEGHPFEFIQGPA